MASVPRVTLAPPNAVETFAVEPTAVQLTWRGLPAEDIIVRYRDGGEEHEITVGRGDHVGAVDITGLRPATTYRFVASAGERELGVVEATTLPQLDGEAIRIATISDLHLGETRFGVTRPFSESDDATPYPLRCALSAVREAQAWGAEVIVIKGDITEHSRPHEWAMFDDVLAEISVPVLAIPGNHDVEIRPESVDGRAELAKRGLLPGPVQVHDLSHARLVLVDTTVRGRSFGHIGAHRDELLTTVTTDHPAMIFTHHHLQPLRVPSIWPLGISPSDHSPLLDELTAANPRIFSTCGHTHRSRAYHIGRIPASEVSSTKDFPGVWAGYILHEDGFHQTVRRVAAPSCLRWTDQTAGVLGGIWGRWSPGPIDQRSFTHRWPS